MNTNTTPQESPNLSLRGLCEALNGRGIKISYSSLSTIINTGDIAEQLQVGGKGNQLQFTPESVEILAGFIPHLRRFGFKPSKRAEQLAKFIRGESVFSSAPTETVVSSAPPGAISLADHAAFCLAYIRTYELAKRERVMTPKQAAKHLKVSKRVLRENIPAWKRIGKKKSGDRWLWTQLIQFFEK